MDPQIEESWKEALREEFQKPYFYQLRDFLVAEKKAHPVYPPGPLIFNAYRHTPLNKVKVVILGQDPYHGPGQAHGLCFSVPEGIPIPPSLVNIYKEIKCDLGMDVKGGGDLTKWADQGVLLLNATLTVRANQAGSHQKKGWETFTDATITLVSNRLEGVVFMLWGRYAQNKATLIDSNRHLVLKAAHPSPLSAYNGFFGCRHFSKANDYLVQTGREPIRW